MYPDPSTYQHRNLKYYSYQCLVTAANNTPVVISVGTDVWKPWATSFIHHTPGKTYESSNEARNHSYSQIILHFTQENNKFKPRNPPDVPQLSADAVESPAMNREDVSKKHLGRTKRYWVSFILWWITCLEVHKERFSHIDALWSAGMHQKTVVDTHFLQFLPHTFTKQTQSKQLGRKKTPWTGCVLCSQV